MKTNFFIFGILLLIGTSLKAENETRYGIKSAIIKKETTLMGQKMESILYFDDYGQKEATELNIKIAGIEKRTLTIAEGETNVSIDLSERKGFRMPIPEAPRNYRNLTESDKEKYKIKEIGKEEILGKPCQKYTMEMMQEGVKFDVTLWIWEGITLKSVGIMRNGQFKVTDEAKEIQENVAVPANKFVIPKDITIQESPAQP